MKTRSTCSRWRRLRISSQSRHSERIVRTTRSAIAFACGARTGVLTIRMPSLRKTLSKEPPYFAVAIANKEADVALAEVETEVARLLGHPLAGGIQRAAAEPAADAGFQARAARRAARCLSRPSRAGYERARPAEPERRGRGRRRPCRRSSHQPSRSGAATPILAPFMRATRRRRSPRRLATPHSVPA